MEAPFIALMVLMHQQRTSRIDELREEIDLQVSLHVERELSMVLRLLGEMQESLAIDSRHDVDLLRYLQEELDPKRLLENLRRELRETEGGSSSTAP